MVFILSIDIIADFFSVFAKNLLISLDRLLLIINIAFLVVENIFAFSLKIEVGEKYDFEIERSDIENVVEGYPVF